MENFVTHNETEINISGIYLVGDVDTTYDKLIEKFGEPSDSDGYKTDAVWDIQFSDGLVASIYNWKNGKNYNGESGLNVQEITNWHIGGFNVSVVDRIKNILK